MKYSLRKGSLLLYFQMKYGISYDIFGSNLKIEYSDESDVIEIYIDLSGNLKTRNKRTNTYIDTKDIESSTNSIDYVQLNDNRTIGLLLSHLRKLSIDDYSFYLHLFIESDHRFMIKLKKRVHDLILKRV